MINAYSRKVVASGLSHLCRNGANTSGLVGQLAGMNPISHNMVSRVSTSLTSISTTPPHRIVSTDNDQKSLLAGDIVSDQNEMPVVKPAEVDRSDVSIRYLNDDFPGSRRSSTVRGYPPISQDYPRPGEHLIGAMYNEFLDTRYEVYRIDDLVILKDLSKCYQIDLNVDVARWFICGIERISQSAINDEKLDDAKAFLNKAEINGEIVGCIFGTRGRGCDYFSDERRETLTLLNYSRSMSTTVISDPIPPQQMVTIPFDSMDSEFIRDQFIPTLSAAVDAAR